ncbi:MAG TPA: hypothetical protein VGP28_03450, partial [Methylocella sp.]|nr:hypothetical protein [Methylocella sp.]
MQTRSQEKLDSMVEVGRSRDSKCVVRRIAKCKKKINLLDFAGTLFQNFDVISRALPGFHGVSVHS